MHWTEESEEPPSLLSKTENQRLNWRKPANGTKHQNQKKTRNFYQTKTKPTIGQIHRTENPNAPLSFGCLEGWKSHFRASRFQFFLGGGYALRPP